MNGVMAAERLTSEGLWCLAGCLALTLLPGVAALPVWISLTAAAMVALRLGLAVRGRDAPPRAMRLLLTSLAIAFLFVQYRTFNGLSAGSALLTIVAGCKFLETRTRRDLYVVCMIVYFLSAASLLESESFWLLGYRLAVCWLTTATLLRLTRSTGRGPWGPTLRHCRRLALQSVPLALAFWLFFPRFGGPLWQLPEEDGAAVSGLGDRMSPGDITALANSDDVAFRVRFAADSPTPQAEERYWRGPVLHDFDGRAWGGTDTAPITTAALRFEGPAYRYTLTLEPTQHRWLFVLDWPATSNAARGFLTGDYMLMQAEAVSRPQDVTATSYARAHASEPLATALRARDTRLPPGRNPRTLALARDMRSRHPDDATYVASVLARFHEEAFYYTLTPPRLAENSVDEFLFDTRRGFCGHYASAFAALMRAAGIPARVVTGYQGGTYNRFADYWILRQSDAHAWTEVWLDGRGWTRVDPTAAIAPERIEHGLTDLVTADAPLTSRWQQRSPWLADTRLRLDALRLLWRERILRFDQDSQQRLLAVLHVPAPDAGALALLLGACLLAGMSWLTWEVRRDLSAAPRDVLERAYRVLCRRLAAVGLPRGSTEGAEAFGARIVATRPDLAAAAALCDAYSKLRYGANVSPADTAHFAAAVRRCALRRRV